MREAVLWHAIVIILTNLCTRFQGPEVDRAWRQTDVVFGRYENADLNLGQSPIWLPIHQLRDQALFKHNNADLISNPTFESNGLTSLSDQQEQFANGINPIDLTMPDPESHDPCFDFFTENVGTF